MHCHQAVRCPAIVAGQWPAPGHACPLWRQTAPVPGGRILVASTATARDWSSAPEPPTQHHTYRLGKAIGTNTARNTTSAQLGRPPQQSIPSCQGHPHKANGPPDPADGNTSPRPLSSRNSKRNFIYCRSKARSPNRNSYWISGHSRIRKRVCSRYARAGPEGVGRSIQLQNPA